MRSFELDAEKALEALVYVAARTRGHDLYKALKALYVADKLHLAKYGRLIYGETYCALPCGPVPKAAYDAVRAVADPQFSPIGTGVGERPAIPRQKARTALAHGSRCRLDALRDAEIDVLSVSDVECLDEAIRTLAFDSFSQAADRTHDSAWRKTSHAGDIALESIVSALPEDRRGPVTSYLDR